DVLQERHDRSFHCLRVHALAGRDRDADARRAGNCRWCCAGRRTLRTIALLLTDVLQVVELPPGDRRRTAVAGGIVCAWRPDWVALSPGAAGEEGDRMTALLEVTGVSLRFGGLHAVSNVSFSIARGEILGLIGPNGAGKTTLFNIVNGVYKVDKGKIVFEGKDITNRPPNEVVHLGVARTHQIVKPLNGMTVLENVT